MLLRYVISVFAASTFVLGADNASSQGLPAKPVCIIVSEHGGSSDFAARLIAQSISRSLGRNVSDVTTMSKVIRVADVRTD